MSPRSKLMESPLFCSLVEIITPEFRKDIDELTVAGAIEKWKNFRGYNDSQEGVDLYNKFEKEATDNHDMTPESFRAWFNNNKRNALRAFGRFAVGVGSISKTCIGRHSSVVSNYSKNNAIITKSQGDGIVQMFGEQTDLMIKVFQTLQQGGDVIPHYYGKFTPLEAKICTIANTDHRLAVLVEKTGLNPGVTGSELFNLSHDELFTLVANAYPHLPTGSFFDQQAFKLRLLTIFNAKWVVETNFVALKEGRAAWTPCTRDFDDNQSKTYRMPAALIFSEVERDMVPCISAVIGEEIKRPLCKAAQKRFGNGDPHSLPIRTDGNYIYLSNLRVLDTNSERSLQAEGGSLKSIPYGNTGQMIRMLKRIQDTTEPLITFEFAMRTGDVDAKGNIEFKQVSEHRLYQLVLADLANDVTVDIDPKVIAFLKLNDNLTLEDVISYSSDDRGRALTLAELEQGGGLIARTSCDTDHCGGRWHPIMNDPHVTVLMSHRQNSCNTFTRQKKNSFCLLLMDYEYLTPARGYTPRSILDSVASANDDYEGSEWLYPTIRLIAKTQDLVDPSFFNEAELKLRLDSFASTLEKYMIADDLAWVEDADAVHQQLFIYYTAMADQLEEQQAIHRFLRPFAKNERTIDPTIYTLVELTFRLDRLQQFLQGYMETNGLEHEHEADDYHQGLFLYYKAMNGQLDNLAQQASDSMMEE